MRFLKKVEGKVERFREVEKLLQDPANSQDQSLLKDLGKEFRGLERVVFLYRDYLKIEEETAEVQKILADKKQTPDLVTMAQQELESLEARRKKVTRDLENLLIQEDPALSKNALLEIRAGTG